MKNIFLIILVTSLNFQYLISQNKEYSFASTYQIDESSNFKIDLFDGDIILNSHNKKTIEAKYTVHQNNDILKISEEDFMILIKDKLEFKTSESIDGVIISLKELSNYSFRNSFSVDIEVYVPRKTNCQFRTSDGNISGGDIDANLICKTGDGDIKINDIKGNVAAKTSDGDISGVDIASDFECKTGDGDIKVSDIKGNVTAKTLDGDISLANINGDANARTGDGDILTKNVTGKLKTHTGDGEIIKRK